MKTSTQLKALTRNIAKEKNVNAEIVLRNFMLERFLERVSLSKYRDKFILKGGILISSLVGIDTRTTMDLDASLKNQNLTEIELVDIIDDIINMDIGDNVIFEFEKIEEIREDVEYNGYRVSIKATLDKTWQMIKLDISTGDPITPSEMEHNFKLMFDSKEINVLAYNLETVLAEKYETIITRGILNTRMRDFYDIYILTKMYSKSINKDILKDAIKNTSQKRETFNQLTESNKVISLVAQNDNMKNQWRRYTQRNEYASGITWEMAIDTLNNLLPS